MPRVSVVVPCYNEQDTIRLLLEALDAQNYSHEMMEVIIADGLSTDQTREQIAAFLEEQRDLTVRVIDNRLRTIPAGLNRAIEAARGEIIVRLDAHSAPRPDYIARCVTALEEGQGDNVGGVWDIHPGGDGWQARAIAVAAAHPLGVGDARYRYTDRAQQVDTVPFGAFRKSLFTRVGPFEETLLTNEDYEFNTRVRQAGGVIWLNPAIRSTYYSRATLTGLAHQYWRYGFWKVRMLRSYPKTLRWRQALPPIFVLSLILFLALSFWFPFIKWLFVIELASYALILMGAGIQMAIKARDAVLIFGVPFAIATMHLSWGSAFLWSMILIDERSKTD